MGMKIFNKQQYGFSIMEVTVVIFIITLGLLGVLSLAAQSIKISNTNKNELIASQLAQEGLELVRNIRDTNWLTDGNDWVLGSGAGNNSDDIIQDGTYTIDNSIINYMVDDIDDIAANLLIDVNGAYSHSMGSASPFNRLITINNWNTYTDFIEVKCEVQWKEGGGIHNYIASTVLYNWR
jgi:type II secretory pathway pseudopilin PulG